MGWLAKFRPHPHPRTCVDLELYMECQIPFFFFEVQVLFNFWHTLDFLFLRKKSFKKLPLKELLKSPGHPVVFTKQYFDELSVNVSETYGLNFP
jgi:hypothetical protein